jgi:hypothetical protein
VPIDDERPAHDSHQGVRPAPITGHQTPLDGSPARVIVCDVPGLAATLDTIDALAHLQPNARKRGCRLQLPNLDGALEEPIALIGLGGGGDTLLPCVSTDHPQAPPLRTPIDTQARGGRQQLGVLPVSSRLRPDLNH